MEFKPKKWLLKFTIGLPDVLPVTVKAEGGIEGEVVTPEKIADSAVKPESEASAELRRKIQALASDVHRAWEKDVRERRAREKN